MFFCVEGPCPGWDAGRGQPSERTRNTVVFLLGCLDIDIDIGIVMAIDLDGGMVMDIDVDVDIYGTFSFWISVVVVMFVLKVSVLGGCRSQPS